VRTYPVSADPAPAVRLRRRIDRRADGPDADVSAGIRPSAHRTPPALLGLQRAAGNAAVSRLLATAPVRDSPGACDPVAVQRCGPVPCDCSEEERASDNAAQDATPAVQRFGSAEHVRIGDEALPGETVLLTGYGRITQGEMIALGDYFGSVSEMSTLVSGLGT
jgi:hypothetical protein